MAQASVTDWIMVIVTIVYVVATIAICKANYESVNATNLGVKESRRQFEEARRLQVMPYIQVRISPGEVEEYSGCPKGHYRTFDILESNKGRKLRGVYKLSFINIGQATLHHAYVVWNSNSKHDDAYSFSYDNQNFALAVNSPYIFTVSFESSPIENNKSDPFQNMYIGSSMTFNYEDLLGNKYSQELKLSFDVTSSTVQLYSYQTTSPRVVSLRTSEA